MTRRTRCGWRLAQALGAVGVACTAVGTRPHFGPMPGAVVDTLGAGPGTVIGALASELETLGLRVRAVSQAEGYLETSWFDPTTGRLVDGGIREQTRQVLRNLQAVLEAAGTGLDRAVKFTVFLSDWKYFKEMNEAYGEFFERNPPARSTVQGDRWPEGHLVAIEAIALVK